MKRTDIINQFIRNRQFQSYLEIGVRNPDDNFNLITAQYKSSVDPDPNAEAKFVMTSDEFLLKIVTNLTLYSSTDCTNVNRQKKILTIL